MVELKTIRKMVRLSECIGLFIVVMMVIPLGSVRGEAGNDDMIGEMIPLNVGDFFDYELDITNMIQNMIDEEGSETAYYEDISTNYKVSVESIETIKVGDTDIETCVLKKEIMMKYTIVDPEQDLKSRMELTVIGREWISKESFRTVGSEETSISIMTITYGESMGSFSTVIESETVTKDTFEEIDADNGYLLQTGKKWSVTDTYTSEITEKSRYKYDTEPFSDWETFTMEDTVIEPNDYEVLSYDEVETPAGTFKAFQITSQVPGEFESEIEFRDQYGIIVQMETYIDGNPDMVMKLKEWKMEGLKDTDGDGIIDVKDAFPIDKAASIDADEDGYPDEWNEGMTEEDSTTLLKLDQFPGDPLKWAETEDSSFGPLVLMVCLVLGTIGFFIVRKRSG